LLKLDAAVCGQENLEPGSAGKLQKLTVLYSGPALLNHRQDVMTGEFASEAARQLLIE
jgi:hypothetical protein